MIKLSKSFKIYRLLIKLKNFVLSKKICGYNCVYNSICVFVVNCEKIYCEKKIFSIAYRNKYLCKTFEREQGTFDKNEKHQFRQEYL